MRTGAIFRSDGLRNWSWRNSVIVLSVATPTVVNRTAPPPEQPRVSPTDCALIRSSSAVGGELRRAIRSLCSRRHRERHALPSSRSPRSRETRASSRAPQPVVPPRSSTIASLSIPLPGGLKERGGLAFTWSSVWATIRGGLCGEPRISCAATASAPRAFWTTKSPTEPTHHSTTRPRARRGLSPDDVDFGASVSRPLIRTLLYPLRRRFKSEDGANSTRWKRLTIDTSDGLALFQRQGLSANCACSILELWVR